MSNKVYTTVVMLTAIFIFAVYENVCEMCSLQCTENRTVNRNDLCWKHWRTGSVQSVSEKANLNAQRSTTPKENNNTIPNKIITRIIVDKIIVDKNTIKYCINITIHIF